MYCKSTRTEHIVLLVMILKNSGVGLGSTMIHPIYAIIQFSTTMVDENGLESKENNHTNWRIMILRLKHLDLI